MKPINNLIIKSASGGGCKSVERASPSYDPGRSVNRGVGWPRSGEEASVQPAREGGGTGGGTGGGGEEEAAAPLDGRDDRDDGSDAAIQGLMFSCSHR